MADVELSNLYSLLSLQMHLLRLSGDDMPKITKLTKGNPSILHFALLKNGEDTLLTTSCETGGTSVGLSFLICEMRRLD